MWVCDAVWSKLAPAPVSICFLVGLEVGGVVITGGQIVMLFQ